MPAAVKLKSEFEDKSILQRLKQGDRLAINVKVWEFFLSCKLLPSVNDVIMPFLGIS